MKYLNKENGLTLIELIISLVIFAIVITLIASGFIFGNKVWATVDRNQTILEELISSQVFIRKILNQAVFYPHDFDEEEKEYFTGEPSKMIFIAPSPQYGLDDYLYIYELYIEKNKYGLNNLSIRYVPANAYFSGAVKEANEKTILFKNAQSIQFKYYGFNAINGKLAWHSRWDNPDALPQLILIDIQTKQSKDVWPQLIVETKYGGYVLQ